jgi:hypothetical protein
MSKKSQKSEKKTPEYKCENCCLTTISKKDFQKHLTTAKHISNRDIPVTVGAVYECALCNLSTVTKSDFKKHLLTAKHLSNTQIERHTANEKLKCEKCTKVYKSRVGLWRHLKTCDFVKHTIEQDDSKDPKDKEGVYNKKDNYIELLIKENSDFKNMIVDMVKCNNELQKQLLEVCKNSTIINQTNMNSNNKTFNLQVFLNEECKDAMNIMEFVDSFTLQLSDLENVGKLGYVEGMSNIILSKLKEIDIHKRPIHCTDAKREIMHIKDNDKWEKECAGNLRLKKAIKYISKKNSNLLVEWSDAHPGSKHINHNANDDYMQLIIQAMGGVGDIETNENKIIKKIAREVLINKV